MTESSLVVRLENEIEPVFWLRMRKVAVLVSPGAMVPSSTRLALSSVPPLTLFALSSTLTRFAVVEEVLRMVTAASYGSPARVVRG